MKDDDNLEVKIVQEGRNNKDIENLISNITYVGSALIFGVGINLIFGKKIKVGNLLPALLVPCVYELILCFAE